MVVCNKVSYCTTHLPAGMLCRVWRTSLDSQAAVGRIDNSTRRAAGREGRWRAAGGSLRPPLWGDKGGWEMKAGVLDRREVSFSGFTKKVNLKFYVIRILTKKWHLLSIGLFAAFAWIYRNEKIIKTKVSTELENWIRNWVKRVYAPMIANLH